MPGFVDPRRVVSRLKSLALKLAKRRPEVEEVRLFGSFATGEAGARSDADLLIVLSQDKRRMMERLDEFILAFAEAPVPVDVLVYTREELARASAQGNRFLLKAAAGPRLFRRA